MEKRRIVLLGATGYTGQRVLRELLARGEKPTLVGRNRTRMLAAADRFEAELPVIEVDVTSAADLTRVLDPGHVVFSTVGPFMQLGMLRSREDGRARFRAAFDGGVDGGVGVKEGGEGQDEPGRWATC